MYAIKREWKSQSYRAAGHALEPTVRPLGWDWRIGVAALASFPAREVVVGTLGILFTAGKVDADAIRDADDAGSTRPAGAYPPRSPATIPRRDSSPSRPPFR